MNPIGSSSYISPRWLLWAAAAGAIFASPAHAILVNKYTFNDSTANDSVGGQNGTIVDPGAPTATFTGGALNLTANGTGGTVASSNQNFTLATATGAYVDLPNGVFHNAVISTDGGAPFGAVSLEIWATPQENRNWARLVDMGTSDGGEDTSGGAPNSSYVIMLPQNGINGRAAASTHSAAGEPFAFGPAALAPNIRHHMVATFDQNDQGGGARPNGTLSLYIDNAAPVLAQIQPGLFLDLITDDNNWLGRAQWPDPLYDGLIDEFRIYNHALTAAEVAANFTAGPEPVPLPVLVVNRSTGAVSLANQTTGGIQLKGYSITSAGGGLNPATWVSIDAGAFDPDGTWTAQSSTSTNLTESVTGGNLNGGTIAAGTSAGIGAPWIKTPIQDLAFSFTLGDGSTATGQIQYTGDPLARSDLNGDGAINAADWALFVPNSFTTFAADTAVAAYRKGDLDGDKDNDYADFKLFKADYSAVNGAAAFAALTGVVPEPSAGILAVAGSLALGAARRRRAAA
jgi:hypothetical protein